MISKRYYLIVDMDISKTNYNTPNHKSFNQFIDSYCNTVYPRMFINGKQLYRFLNLIGLYEFISVLNKKRKKKKRNTL